MAELSTLPLGLFELTGLTSLNLGSNRFTTMAPEIGRLAAPRDLRLYSKRLTALPMEIGQLRARQWLRIEKNRLIELPADANKEARLELFQACMDDLNEVNNDEDLEHGIDTEERDHFCDLLAQIAGMAGLNNIDDVLAQRDS